MHTVTNDKGYVTYKNRGQIISFTVAMYVC